MDTLVIYAHPDNAGHSSLALEYAERELKRRKVDYEVIDLYKIKYDPVLHENEHYTSSRDNRHITAQNKAFQEKITEADTLLFIYPLWWNSMPAILKGFFDKILTPGFAYHFTPNGFPVPHLTKKRAATIVCHGSMGLFYKLVLGHRGEKIVTRDTLGFCGVKAKHFDVYNGAKPVDDAKKAQIKRATLRAITYLYG